MPRKSRKRTIDRNKLTRMQLRKLNALTKSVGDEIGEHAFREWLKSLPKPNNGADANVELMTDALAAIRDQLKFSRGGSYLVRQGRGRVIVEPALLEH